MPERNYEFGTVQRFQTDGDPGGYLIAEDDGARVEFGTADLAPGAGLGPNLVGQRVKFLRVTELGTHGEFRAERVGWRE